MPIPYSNLILLVKDLNCPLIDDMYYKMTVKAEEYNYMSNSCESQTCLPCFKTTRTLYRRRPASCISQNKNVCIQKEKQNGQFSLSLNSINIQILFSQESEILQCGHGNTISISLIFIVLAMFIGQIL